MKKLLIWVTGNKVEEGYTPSDRFKVKLDESIRLYNDNVDKYDQIEILVSGRWSNSTDEFLKTESRVGRDYILEQLPNAFVFEENISVDLIGNFAFSKQLIVNQNPDTVIGIMSEFLKDRVLFLGKKVIASDIKNLQFVFTNSILDNQYINRAKQQKAFQLLQNFLADVEDGDDARVRDKLLYQTPYYYRVSQKQNKDYFDKFWPGGFEDFISKRRDQIQKESML